MSAAMGRIVAQHERDIRCPWCGAEPGQPCHTRGGKRWRAAVHTRRTEHLWGAYSAGWNAAYSTTREAVGK